MLGPPGRPPAGVRRPAFRRPPAERAAGRGCAPRFLRTTPFDAIYAPCPAPGPSARRPEDDHLSPDTTAAPVPGPTAAAPHSGATPATSESLLAAIVASLEDDKALDIVAIDLRGRSEMGDFMVIASGRSSRQVSAIADHLAQRLKDGFGLPAKTEGKDAGDWVLIDAGDVIVHVFRPEVREFYQLEKMWLPPGSAAESAPGAAQPRRTAEGAAGPAQA
jgi:ribosome-associated protein